MMKLDSHFISQSQRTNVSFLSPPPHPLYIIRKPICNCVSPIQNHFLSFLSFFLCPSLFKNVYLREKRVSQGTFIITKAFIPSTASPSTTAIGVPFNSTNQFADGPNDSNTMNVQSRSPVAWSTGLCNCCDDCSSCCLTCWCPCIAFGRIAEIVDQGSTSCGVSGSLYALIMYFTGCACIYSCFYRSKLREQYFLEESPCKDCCVHCWCEECALCQEYRELQNQGFDLSIGWHGNMERQKRLKSSTAPVVQGGMTR